jgi:FtsH-binding integral membrane protein
MNRAVWLLAIAMLIEMVFSAINKALAPYEAPFYRYGGVVVMVILLVCALVERWSRHGQARLRTTGRAQPESTTTSVVVFRR